MKKKFIAASVAVGLLLFWAVIHSVGAPHIFSTFKEVNKFWLVIFLCVSALLPVVLIFRWHIILVSHNTYVPFWKLFLFRLGGFAMGYLTPSAQFGGDSLRALLLAREKVTYSKAFSSVLIDKSLEMTTNIVFACIGFVFIILTLAITRNTETIIALALAASIALLSFFYYRILHNKGFFSSAFRLLRLHRHHSLRRFENHVRDTEINIARFFKFNKSSLKMALGLSLISWVLMFIEYETALLTFNIDASISTVFLVITVMGAAYVVPIPAALGVLEGGQASLFKLIQVPPEKGVALGLLVRVRDIGWVLIGIFYMFNYGWNVSKKRLTK